MTLHVPLSVEWLGGLDGCARILDQTLLPLTETFIDARDVETIREAIWSLRVRGAPAIGVAAAYGVFLGVRDCGDATTLRHRLAEVSEALVSARPTAVNLAWAVQRMIRAAGRYAGGNAEDIRAALLREAHAIRDEDVAMCLAIGEAGLPLIRDGVSVLTHCNAGALATVGLGTALAPLYLAHRAGRRFRVFANETRPLLQGARLTAWELSRAGIDVTLLVDSAAASLMQQGRVDLIITGADRVAANGDAANKIGTYALAVLARAHGIPFYIAAPSSTFDLALPTGAAIPIEERSPEEIRSGFGRPTAPSDVPCYAPAFDVTPSDLLAGLITDRGLIAPVTAEAIRQKLTFRSPCRDTSGGR
jgi:methylthioribose-1-phosphate isomerase